MSQVVFPPIRRAPGNLEYARPTWILKRIAT